MHSHVSQDSPKHDHGRIVSDFTPYVKLFIREEHEAVAMSADVGEGSERDAGARSDRVTRRSAPWCSDTSGAPLAARVSAVPPKQ